MGKVPPEQFDIEKIRAQYVGKKGKKSVGHYPVELDPIRRHEHMCHGKNPLFLDPEYGKNSKYGANIAPGVMADYFSASGPPVWPDWGGGDISTMRSGDPELSVPTLGDRAINLNTQWEFFLPIKVGDWLWSEPVIADVYVKPIRLDPKAVWTVNETRIYNQRDELVAISRNTGLSHRSPEEVAADPDTEKLQQQRG